MKKIKAIISLLLMAVLFLSGCNMRTVDEMYCLPKRSENDTNLQSLIDSVMGGREYSAPLSGENRQTVQMADLDGDGEQEYLLFAKGGSDRPLQIYIFGTDGKSCYLMDTIESSGSAFEQVEYVQMDDRPGVEIVVGRQVNDQVLRTVAVYTLLNGHVEQMVAANYSKFVCVDLDKDEFSELLVLRPDSLEPTQGVAELYGIEGGVMERSAEVNMSESSDSIKRIMVGTLNDNVRAVYVASDVGGTAIVTDIYAIVNDMLTNVSFSSEAGTSVQTMRNYYVFADDIDNDGVLELPSLISVQVPDASNTNSNQYLIRWYAMTSKGKVVNKQYTYHNFVGGWYIQLDRKLAQKMTVNQQGNSYEFYIWNSEKEQSDRLFTIFVLTGKNREEQAVIANRFVLHRTESTLYAAKLDVTSASYGISRDDLMNSFHLILQDWNTGET